MQPERFIPLSEPILVIDNDSLMLTAMASQLKDWGFSVVTAKDQVSAESELKSLAIQPAFIVADYHLDDDKNGVDLLQNLFAKFNWQVPCVICSADPSEPVRQHTSDAKFLFLRKPVKALALKTNYTTIISIGLKIAYASSA